MRTLDTIPDELRRRLGDLGHLGDWDVVDRLAEHTERAVHEPVVGADPEFLEWIVPWMETFARWFDGEVRGMERIPRDGPVLLVGNHSGGTLTPDTSVFFSAWYREMGFARPLVGLAFDGMFGIPGVRTLMRRIGEVPASHESAGRALDEGAAVLVYPGGDRECFRPFTDRNRIDFTDRSGFIRLALQHRVPVVPVVGHGGHETTIVLARGEAAARRLRLGRLRMGIAPVLWQVPWGVSLPLLPGVPLPAKITMQVLEPMAWSHLGPEDANDPEVVSRCFGEITLAMQDTLSGLARERPSALASRLRGLLGAGGG